jgi:uncharacterized protein
MALADETYMAITTYKRDGTPVSTPVWVAPAGTPGEVCFTTGVDSGKVKRLRHTARVTVQPSDVRGTPKPGTEPVEARARIVEGEAFEPVRAAIDEKYGVKAKAIDGVLGVTRRLRGDGPMVRCGVVVTLPPGT